MANPQKGANSDTFEVVVVGIGMWPQTWWKKGSLEHFLENFVIVLSPRGSKTPEKLGGNGGKPGSWLPVTLSYFAYWQGTGSDLPSLDTAKLRLSQRNTVKTPTWFHIVDRVELF